MNFVIFFFTAPSKGEKISAHDGGYVVVRGGAVVRMATEEAYLRQQAVIAGGFSGHWMLFYWAAVTGICDGLRRRRAEEAAGPRPPAPADRGGRAGAPRLSPWLHATIASVLSLVCFFAGPIAVNVLLRVAWPASPEEPRPGSAVCCLAPLFFGSAILGLSLPGWLFARLVAARCPHCAGRCFCEGHPLFGGPAHYVCRDCGRPYALQGR